MAWHPDSNKSSGKCLFHPFGPDLDGIGGQDTACQATDQCIGDIKTCDDLAIAIAGSVDARAANRDNPPKQPQLFAFGIGVRIALGFPVGTYFGFGRQAGCHGNAKHQPQQQVHHS